MIIKKEKIELPKEDVNYILLSERKSDKLDEFLALYKEDRYKARVYFFNNKPDLSITRKVVFEKAKGNFEIAEFTRKFGMSKTNIIYNRERKNQSIIYKDKKFYFRGSNGRRINSAITQLCYGHIAYANVEALAYLLHKFPWIRNIQENPSCHTVCFSTIMRNKLFNADKILKHLYKAPKPVIKVLLDASYHGQNMFHHKRWVYVKSYLLNIESLKSEFVNSHYFHDALEMAIKLDKKINCSWSLKRLKEEHDNWSQDLTRIMLSFEKIVDLKPYPIFVEFEKRYGYKLLRTNHELIMEGNSKRHCVGGYSHTVSRGQSGIFQVDGYTLELRYDTDIGKESRKILLYSQLRGYLNANPPKELDEKIKKFVEEFSKDFDYVGYEKLINTKGFMDNNEVQYVNLNIGVEEALPF
jgi:hypothetical protein